jgi:hypothetical protein
MMNTKNVWFRNVKGKDALAVLDIDGKITLKQSICDGIHCTELAEDRIQW